MKHAWLAVLPSGLALPLALALPPAAQARSADGAVLTAYGYDEGGRAGIGVVLRGASGPAFLWMVRAAPAHPDEPGGWVPVGLYALDERGGGAARAPLPGRSGTAQLGAFQQRAVFLRGARAVAVTSGGDSSLELPLGQPLDFDWGMGGVPQAAGAIVSSTQPWAEILQITASDDRGPEAAILVDADHWAEALPPPRGGDLPRQPPPTGGGEPLGLLLVVAADVTDADGDGLVDAPASEADGGLLTFHFSNPSKVSFVTLFDIDEDGGKIRAYLDRTLLGETDIPNAGDLSVQDVWVPSGTSDISRLEVELAGSGGIVQVLMHPCPSIVNFDETATGVPVDTQVGGQPSDDYSGLGLFDPFLFVDNNHPGHPDLGVLFDTGNVTGGDSDLATPGYGIGNDQPLGKVLIIAEDDVDLDGDGLLDDPDDEASGGVVIVAWTTSDVFLRSVTVVDVDVYETGLLRIEQVLGDWIEIPFAPLGDNSVQTITTSTGPTRRVEFHFSGSAAVAELRFCAAF